MSDSTFEATRRATLQSAVALAVAAISGGVRAQGAAPVSATGESESEAKAKAPPPGKPGDFDFLSGEWTIQHRRLRDGVWDEFSGEATCWSILGGIASIEELRIPARQFSGMGLRLLDVERAVWTDFWVNARSGVLVPPGLSGHFIDGAGIFIADDTDQGQPIKVRGRWDRITARSCRWEQAVSRDGGQSWDTNWSMDWTRA